MSSVSLEMAGKTALPAAEATLARLLWDMEAASEVISQVDAGLSARLETLVTKVPLHSRVEWIETKMKMLSFSGDLLSRSQL